MLKLTDFVSSSSDEKLISNSIGTNSDTFQIGSHENGPILKNNLSLLEVRNSSDSTYSK